MLCRHKTFRRCFFLFALFLLLPLPARAGVQDSVHYMAQRSAQSGSLPGEALTLSGFYALLGREEGGDQRTLSTLEVCSLLCSYLQEEKLVLPQRRTDSPENFDPDGSVALLTCFRGGILGDSYDASKAHRTMTVASACLLLSRFLNACSAPPYEQPVSSLPAKEDETLDSLNGSLMMGHSLANGLYYTTESPMVYAARDGVSTYEYLFTDMMIPGNQWGFAENALNMEPYKNIYILLGTNDLSRGLSALENYRQQLSEIIEFVRTRQPKARLCLVSISPIGFDSHVDPAFQQDSIREYNRVQKSLSRRYEADYLDIFSALASVDGYNRPELTRDDGLHYEQAGYELLLREIYTHPMK